MERIFPAGLLSWGESGKWKDWIKNLHSKENFRAFPPGNEGADHFCSNEPISQGVFFGCGRLVPR
jgi:hypothetical protein